GRGIDLRLKLGGQSACGVCPGGERNGGRDTVHRKVERVITTGRYRECGRCSSDRFALRRELADIDGVCAVPGVRRGSGERDQTVGWLADRGKERRDVLARVGQGCGQLRGIELECAVG